MTTGSPLSDQLVASGRVALLEARGRRSGRIFRAPVGFVPDEGEGDSLLVAASASAQWARNLLADPRCRVTIGERSFDAVAEELGGAEAARAIRELILKYGTPSESLGAGPAFRLRPVTAASG